jgi:hypothetical protein
MNSISTSGTSSPALAVMNEYTVAALQSALSNICCWPRRAGRAITTEREAATETKKYVQ